MGGIWPAHASSNGNSAPSVVQIVVAVDDLADTVARAAQLGAKVLVPPQELPGGDAMAACLDPAGISFGLFRQAVGAQTHSPRQIARNGNNRRARGP